MRRPLVASCLAAVAVLFLAGCPGERDRLDDGLPRVEDPDRERPDSPVGAPPGMDRQPGVVPGVPGQPQEDTLPRPRQP
jgi:hypothetical protein